MLREAYWAAILCLGDSVGFAYSKRPLAFVANAACHPKVDATSCRISDNKRQDDVSTLIRQDDVSTRVAVKRLYVAKQDDNLLDRNSLSTK